jgi:hypothetical protein
MAERVAIRTDGETPRTIADRLLEKAAALTSEANKILAKAQP